MNVLKDLLKKVESSSNFTEFKKIHSDSYFCAVFASLDLKTNKDQISLDYYIPSSKKIASVDLDSLEIKTHEDEVDKISVQDQNITLDIKDLEECSKNASKEKFPLIKIEKIIAILKGDIWNLTLMSSSLDLLRLKINAKNPEEIISLEKVSFFEIAKISKKPKTIF